MIVYCIAKVNFREAEDGDGYYAEPSGFCYVASGFRVERAARIRRDELEREAKARHSPFEYQAPHFCCDLEDLNVTLDNHGHSRIGEHHELEAMWSDLSEACRLELWGLADFSENWFYSIQRVDVEDCVVREPATT